MTKDEIDLLVFDLKKLIPDLNITYYSTLHQLVLVGVTDQQRAIIRNHSCCKRGYREVHHTMFIDVPRFYTVDEIAFLLFNKVKPVSVVYDGSSTEYHRFDVEMPADAATEIIPGYLRASRQWLDAGKYAIAIPRNVLVEE